MVQMPGVVGWHLKLVGLRVVGESDRVPTLTKILDSWNTSVYKVERSIHGWYKPRRGFDGDYGRPSILLNDISTKRNLIVHIFQTFFFKPFFILLTQFWQPRGATSFCSSFMRPFPDPYVSSIKFRDGMMMFMDDYQRVALVASSWHKYHIYPEIKYDILTSFPPKEREIWSIFWK